MGRELPPIGFGTAPRPGLRPLDLAPAIEAALAAGCRLFDTAEVYGTEGLLGAALARRRGGSAPGVAVATKAWQTNHAPEHLAAACRGSLSRLGLEALDLYLVHAPASWPYSGPIEVDPSWSAEEIAARVVPSDEAMRAHAAIPLDETWEAMLELRRQGLAHRVGLSNVDVSHLSALAARGLEAPAAVEVEMHPHRPRRSLLAYCRERGIRLLAHSPFGGGAALGDPRLAAAAREAGASPAQLVLRWHAARGVVALPGSRRPAHVVEAFSVAAGPAPAAALELIDDMARDDDD